MKMNRLIAVVALAAGCGAVGVAAPAVIGAREDTGCPAADEVLAHTKASLDLPAVTALKPHLERILVEQLGLRVLVQGAAAMLTDVEQATFDRLLAGINPSAGLGGLTPHLVEVLRYLDGSSAHLHGEHMAPVTALHAMFSDCPAPATLSTARRLLQLEVRAAPDGGWLLAGPGAGEASWLYASLEALRAVTADATLAATLADLELEDEAAGQGTVRVGRAAFQLLAVLLVENLAAPDFDPAATRALLEDTLLVRIPDAAARAKVDAALDVLLLIAEPSAEVFPQTQALMACVNTADQDAAIAGMIYDWLTIEALPLDAFLGDISDSTSSSSTGDLRLALVDLLSAVEARPALATDVVRVLGAFLDEQTAPSLIDALLGLQGQGMLMELVSLADAVDSCRGLSP